MPPIDPRTLPLAAHASPDDAALAERNFLAALPAIAAMEAALEEAR